ncbi:hypothetical protein PV326_000809 [Microctonus aethiopoides]|nr:hypothetical protein PV326_000809 [Microctonus aethiopoides]
MQEKISDKYDENKMELDFMNESENVKKKMKRKKNKQSEAPIDKKKVKLENAEDKLSKNPLDNNHENDENISTNELENKITGNYVRKALTKGGGIGIIRKFVAICTSENNQDLAGEYLEAKGSVLEILRLLDESDKKNSANAAIIFSAMQIVIMKIISKYPQYITNAEEACRHFINSHLSSVHSMFSSQSIPQHRKICLRLLTAIVSLGGNLPRELLGHLSFHSQTLDLLSQHIRPSDANNVRTCFIHFIISFLVDGSISVIRALLDKRGMLTSIFPGLIYDKSTIVHLVLTTVKTYVLENNLVSKTTKLQIFSTPVVQSLVNLYNWKGPAKWPGINPKKSKKVTGPVDPEEKRMTTEVVHEFLSLLLTSTRHGIIFNDKSLGTSGRKHNQLANTVLQSLDKPWEHDKPRELVTKILSSSPDLIKSQYNYMEPFMTPRLSTKWIQLMQFIESIIQGVNYELILKPNLNELTFSQLISVSTTFSMPQIVLKNAVIPAINDSNIILRHQAIEILTIMLEQMKNICHVVEDNNCNDKHDVTQFKKAISDYIVKNSLEISDILRKWRQTFIQNNEKNIEENSQDNIETPSDINHFSAIIDLFLIYRDICPVYLEELNSINEMNIGPIVLLEWLDKIKIETYNEKFNEIKVKVIQFILLMNSNNLITNAKFFQDSVVFLISLLFNESKNTKLSLSSHETLKMILISTEIFKDIEDQVEIWINSFRLLNNNDIVDVAKWFVKILQRSIKHTDKYMNQIREFEKKNLVDECDSINFDTKMMNIQPSQSIPLSFCAAIDDFKSISNENVSNYLSFVAILTLHCQINPGPLINLTENIETLPNKYLSSWNTKNGMNITKPFNKDDLIRKYSKVLLTNKEIKWENLFSGDEKLEINFNNENKILNYSLNNYEILMLLRITLFYLTQSLRQKNMDNGQFQRYKVSIFVLLHIVIKTEDKKLIEEFLRLLFTNPILLQYFSPLPTENTNNPLELMITNEFVFEIAQTIVEKIQRDDLSISKIFFPFKQKYLLHMQRSIDKSMNGWRHNDTISLDKFIEVFQLNLCDLLNLLNRILDLPNKIILSVDKNYLSSWGKIIPKLIDLLLETNEKQEREKNSALTKKILNHLSQLLIKSKANLDDWFKAMEKYLKKYPHNIGIIDAKLFKLFFQGDLSNAKINLIGLLINRNDELISQYTEIVTKINPKLIQLSELIFKIISSNLFYKWDINLMQKIFEQYSNDFVNYFACESTESNSWIDNNLSSSSYFINATFDEKICGKIINKILSSGDKLDQVNINYIKMLRCLVTKSTEIEKKNNSMETMINFIQILIRIGVYALKKNSVNDRERLELVCEYLCEAIDNLKLISNEITLEEVKKNNSWPQFSRFSLKIGLKSSGENEKISSTLIKTLAEICSIAYKNNSDNESVKTTFELITNHSAFMKIMLGKNINIKCELLNLIYVLIRKNYSLMQQTHIPLYLSAYNATLNKCDQIILMILQHYEKQKIKFHDYKPYFWGEAAINYYSVKGEADTALWRQPSTSQIFDLFNIDIVTNTIENFPIDRNLNNDKLANITVNNVYDPAFYLPLMTYLLADNNVVMCNRVTQNGALSLTLAACGSACEDVRIAAFTVLSRFYFHLEATSHKEKLLWIRILDGLKNGLTLPIKETKISCLVSTFLAKASLVSTEPLNPLFSPIQLFFMAKPALDLNMIPEFLTLFHSSDINHKVNRHWILQMIRDGIKSEFDMDLALKCVLFRMLFDFYHSILADSTTQNLILEIVNASVKIPKAQLLLVRGYSLLVWLNNVTIKIINNDRIGIKLILNIIRNLLNNNVKTNDHEHNLFMLLNMMKNLIPKLTRNLDIDILNNYLMTLNDSSKIELFNEVIRKNDIELLINLSNKITEIDVDECNDIINNGCKFINRHELMDVTNKNANKQVNSIQYNLRKLIINWQSHDVEKKEM